MKIDEERIGRYLAEIKARHGEIEHLLAASTDAESLMEPWILKGLKYTLVEIAEAMANVLQHILAKDMGEPVTGYKDSFPRQGRPRRFHVLHRGRRELHRHQAQRRSMSMCRGTSPILPVGRPGASSKHAITA